MTDALTRLFQLQQLTGAYVAEGIPDSIVDKCPIFVTYEQSGEEDYRTYSQEVVREATTYVMALYVESMTKQTAEARQQLARDYIRRVRMIFAPRRQLEYRDPQTGELNDTVFDATYEGYTIRESAYPSGSDNIYLVIYFRIVVGQVYPQDYDFDLTFVE